MIESGIVHDESAFPLVLVSWNGEVTDAEIQRFFEDQKRMLKRRQPYVQIADASNAKVMNSAQRREIVKFSDDTGPAAAQFCKGTATIITNSFVRGAMTAVLWMVKLPYPVEMVTNFDDARARCDRWARDAGIALPPVRRFANG